MKIQQHLLQTISLALLVSFVLALPGLVYVSSLALLPKLPSPPTTSQIDEHSKYAWASSGGHGLYLGRVKNAPMEMERLDPWSITWHLLVRCKRDTGSSADLHACVYHYPGYMAAVTAANSHFRHLGYPDRLSSLQSVAMVALTVWITRHWSPEQVAAYLRKSSLTP